MADEAPLAPAPPTESPSLPPTAAPSSTPPTVDGPPSILNEGKEAPPEQGAPDAYSEFTVPEGYTLDPETSRAAGELFKGMNLTQGHAQKLVDFYVNQTQEAFNAPFKAYERMIDGWVKEVKALPEIGGRLDQVRSVVHNAVDSLGDATLARDFYRAMDLTGAGNHPAFVRVFYKLAQMVTEGNAVSGRGPSPHGQAAGQSGRPSLAQAMYPTLPSG